MSKTILKGEKNRVTSADVSVAEPNGIVVLTGEHGCEASHPLNQQPTNTHEEAIRALTHSRWEAAGCPAGDGCDFLLEA